MKELIKPNTNLDEFEIILPDCDRQTGFCLHFDCLCDASSKDSRNNQTEDLVF